MRDRREHTNYSFHWNLLLWLAGLCVRILYVCVCIWIPRVVAWPLVVAACPALFHQGQYYRQPGLLAKYLAALALAGALASLLLLSTAAQQTEVHEARVAAARRTYVSAPSICAGDLLKFAPAMVLEPCQWCLSASGSLLVAKVAPMEWRLCRDTVQQINGQQVNLSGGSWFDAYATTELYFNQSSLPRWPCGGALSHTDGVTTHPMMVFYELVWQLSPPMILRPSRVVDDCFTISGFATHHSKFDCETQWPAQLDSCLSRRARVRLAAHRAERAQLQVEIDLPEPEEAHAKRKFGLWLCAASLLYLLALLLLRGALQK